MRRARTVLVGLVLLLGLAAAQAPDAAHDPAHGPGSAGTATAGVQSDGPGATGEPVVVEVGARPLGPVPGHATSGFNYGNAMRVVGYEASFAAVRIDTIRFPPGNQADEIRLGRADLEALAMNLDLLGRPPVLMVANLFGGTPEDAADLARLAREMDLPVLAWEIGNEPDLYATNRGDPSWTPERWCASFRAYRSALLEVDPDVRVAGPAVSGSRPLGAEFLREALRLCGDVIDVLTWHVYPTDGTWSDEDALATSHGFAEEVERFRAWAADPATNPRGHDREITFGVTEFGLSWRSASFRHLEDMTAALWLADVLGQMTSARIDVSHYFALQGTGGHGLVDVGGWVRPTYHVYAMLAGFVGEALPVRTAAPLRAYAVRNGTRTQVLLINGSETPLRVEIRLEAADVDRLALATLTESIFDAHGGPELRSASATDPVPVPSRGVVHVAVPAAP